MILPDYGITARLFAGGVEVYFEISRSEDTVRLPNVLDIIPTWAALIICQ